MANKLINYLKETKGELRHVKWLTRKQTINYTLVVIVFSIAVALFLGFFDYIFSYIIKTFVLK